MGYWGKVHGFHFYLFLLLILDVSDVTTDCDYLISFIYHLGLNLDIALRLFSFEYNVTLLINFINFQVDQICPQVHNLNLINECFIPIWLIITCIGVWLFLRSCITFILKYKVGDLYFKLLLVVTVFNNPHEQLHFTTGNCYCESLDVD